MTPQNGHSNLWFRYSPTMLIMMPSIAQSAFLRKSRKVSTTSKRRDLRKYPIPKRLHLALADRLRWVDQVEAGDGFQRMVERPDQPAGSPFNGRILLGIRR